MENRSDEQLIVDYLSGDEKALEILIKRYLKPIYTFVFRSVWDKQESEDITQEIFVKAWRNLNKFNKKKKFKSWIFTIAKNTCLDWQKKKRILQISDSIENIPDNNHLLPDELSEKNDLRENLEKALKNISFEYRTVLLLRYNDHLTFREIAEILEKPLNTVKSYHRRAIILLQRFLKGRNY